MFTFSGTQKIFAQVLGHKGKCNVQPVPHHFVLLIDHVNLEVTCFTLRAVGLS